MWFGLAKIALQTGAKVYANKQKQKEAMAAENENSGNGVLELP